MNIGGLHFVLSLAFVLGANSHASNAPEVVIRVFSWAIDHKVRLLIYEILALVLTHLKVRRKLNCVGWAGFLAETAKNTARKVDAEELWISAAVFVFSRL